MQADRTDRQEMKPHRTGMADIHDRDKPSNRYTGEADRKKKVMKKRENYTEKVER
jgi:hypothetical protein